MRAIIRPLAEATPFAQEDLTLLHKMSFMQNALFNYLLQVSIDGSESVLVDGHFINPRPRANFHTSTLLSDYFHAANFSLSREEFKMIADELNQFISRIEKIDRDHLGSLFGVLGDKVYAKTEKIRRDFISLLQSKWNIQSPFKPLDVAPPAIKLPRGGLDFSKKDLPEFLWNYYFQPSAHAQDEFLQKFLPIFKEHSLGRDDLVESAQKYLAQYPTPKNYHLGPSLSFDHSVVPMAQLSLNPHNAKTLVIVPMNDQEAITTSEIAKKAGASVFPINKGHGVKLEDIEPSDFLKIKEMISRESIERVVIMEIPEKNSGYEDSFKRRLGVKEFFIVDHHFYGTMDRSSHYSSLEQVAHILGYKINSLEALVAASDRSFVYGLGSLGLSRDEVLLFSQEVMGRKVRQAKGGGIEGAKGVRFESPHGSFYIFENREGFSMGRAAFQNLIGEFPDVINTLSIKDRNLRFLGQ